MFFFLICLEELLKLFLFSRCLIGFGCLRRPTVSRRRGTIHLGFVLVTEALGCFSFYWGKLRGTFQIFFKQEESGWNPTPSGLV